MNAGQGVRSKIVFFGVLIAIGCAASAQAERVTVAVAANFAVTLRDLQTDFEDATGHALRVVSGSTGKLYAQIVNGAPFDVFLAADAREPQRLEAEGLMLPGNRFTYALGSLVMWRQGKPHRGPLQAAALRDSELRRLALANPKTAPYGRAAVEVLQALGLYERLRGRIALGENVAQAYQFVATGNAELGFVARSQVLAEPKSGDYWLVSTELYRPIRQQGGLLQRARENAAAVAFVEFLKSPATQARIVEHGYQEVPTLDP